MSSEDRFSTSLGEFIDTVFPEFDAKELIAAQLQAVERLDAIYAEMESIAENRDRYNLHWALREAGVRHGQILEELEIAVHEALRPCIESRECEELATIDEEIRDIDRLRSWSILHNAKYYSTISFAVSLVDIAVSVCLIVLISEIAQLGGSLLSSLLLGVLFVAFIALLKVTLDRFYIIPAVERWGWRQYADALDLSLTTMVKLKGISMVMAASVDRDYELDTIIAIIRRGIKSI